MSGEYNPPTSFILFLVSHLVTGFTTKPLGGVVSQSLIHSGLKQHYHQGKLKTFDQLAVQHSSGKKKALWVLINILDMSKDKNKALL